MRASLAVAAAVALATLSVASPSDAAERWVDRAMTQHRLVFAGDAGLGVGFVHFNGFGTDASYTGVGLNLEGAIGVTDRLELGLRTGVRFGDDAKITHADEFGRTLWTETYNAGGATFANPELRIRWIAYSGSTAEVGLDGRVYMPTADGSHFGLAFGVPLAFHFADFVRLDTGVYVPILFYDPNVNGLVIPAYFWFQASEKLWLGPMAALRFVGGHSHKPTLDLGFGLGYQVASMVDLKGMLLFNAVDQNDLITRFGFGFGVQFRIGE